MLLTDNEIEQRIQSPLNLVNRIKAPLAKKASNVYEIDSLISDLDSKLALPKPVPDNRTEKEKIADKSFGLMMKAMDSLDQRIEEVQKPEKIATIIRDLSQVIKNTDNEVQQNNNLQFIFTVPMQRQENEYEIIETA